MTPTIQVDATKAFAKFSPSGIPLSVKNNLRQVLPSLGLQLGRLVNAKLDNELKSRKNINVTQEMRETTNAIYVQVAAKWLGPAASKMVPQVLESGSRPHEIAARNAGALFFFWDKAGTNVMFKRVQHPGFPGIHYMANSLAEMNADIITTLRKAVVDGMNVG